MRLSRRSFGFLLLSVIALVLSVGALSVARQIYADMKLQRAADAISPTRFSGDWEKAAMSVLIIGDSRVARWTPLPEDNQIAFALSGSGGETSNELRGRVGRHVQSLSPDVVIIMVGVNDIVAAQVNPSKAAGLDSALLQNVMQIAQISKSSGAKPVIAAIGQAGPIDWRRGLMGIDDVLYARIDDANRGLRTTAERSGAGWFDVNDAFGAPGSNALPPDLVVDTLHWDAKAYEKLNRHLVRHLES